MNARLRTCGRMALPAAFLWLLAGCDQRVPDAPRIAGADARRGHALITQYGCGTCHVIPGVAGAKGLVGPPLEAWIRRTYVAGKYPNQPDLLVQWLLSPQTLAPGTAMPDLGLTEDEARDVAAYLYGLR